MPKVNSRDAKDIFRVNAVVEEKEAAAVEVPQGDEHEADADDFVVLCFCCESEF